MQKGQTALFKRLALSEDRYTSTLGNTLHLAEAIMRLECVYELKRIKPGLKSSAVENLHR